MDALTNIIREKRYKIMAFKEPEYIMITMKIRGTLGNLGEGVGNVAES